MKKHSASFTLIVAFVCLTLIGLVTIPLLPVKLLPSHDLPGLTIVYGMSGHSSREIEKQVTSRLEGMLVRVRGIKNISSTSNNDWGRIRLDLDKHNDIDATRFEVSTIIRQAWEQLPEGVSYPQIKTQRVENKSHRPFISYTLNASSSPFLIQQYAEENIKPLLSQLKGVSKVDLSGATPMELEMKYDYHQLEQLGLSLEDLQTAIKTFLNNDFLGFCRFEKSNGEKEWFCLVCSSGINEENFDAKAISLPTKSGRVMSLDQLVRIKHVEQKPTGYYRINGLNSVYLYITAEETANQLKLGEQVKKLMNRLQTKMKGDYQVLLSYDATEYINHEMNKIYVRTGLTILILLLFVLFITRNIRYLFLIVTSLIVNIAVAIIFYYLFGLEIQLYSLAGITISLSLIIDNTIVMTDHYFRCRNLKAFVSILTATLTTIGALAIIFLLNDKIRLNLQDFSAVVIINLMVSLVVALFFVPSMMDKIGLLENNHSSQNKKISCQRFVVRFSHLYGSFINILSHHRVIACLLLLLTFGFPFFMLPERIEGEGKIATAYNEVFDHPTFKEEVRPILNKVLGGTLYLFVKKVYEGSYFKSSNTEPAIYIYKNLPNGTTLDEMNELIKKMETYLSQFKGIRQFHTSIYNAQRANISVYFTKESQNSDFPYELKDNIITKAMELGGGSWNVEGLREQGFDNRVFENTGRNRVKLCGYNYDELNDWCHQLKDKLLKHRRIKDVYVNSEFSIWKDDYNEYFLSLDKEKMTKEGLTVSSLFKAFKPILERNASCGNVLWADRVETIRLSSLQSETMDLWKLINIPFNIGGKVYKLSDFVTLEKSQLPRSISKENQQYILCLQYDYIGSFQQATTLLKKDLEEFNAQLPIGYVAEDAAEGWSWVDKDRSQYALLLLIVVIIFFTTSILFNSLKQPLAIIFVIPISYIGVFLTFYLFRLNFDQGGFASFVLLCGITVNASIYILNEYNEIRKKRSGLKAVRAYIKAWNHKIFPIFLTVISTILGFIPFLLGGEKEAFWFPLAAGTIGGLVMSLLGIFIFLPIFTLNGSNFRKVIKK